GVGTDAYLHLSRSRNAIEHTSDLSTLLHSSVSDMMGFSPDISDAASSSPSASSGLV
ncbi:hypothetical protein LPJ57_006270, partial [Coemansia sp. RSA 486]